MDKIDKMTIDITKITNPIVRRALENRARHFMFNYGDHYETSRVTSARDKKYDDEYNAYQEHFDRHNDYSDSRRG